jgi:hypothetical protein
MKMFVGFFLCGGHWNFVQHLPGLCVSIFFAQRQQKRISTSIPPLVSDESFFNFNDGVDKSGNHYP